MKVYLLISLRLEFNNHEPPPSSFYVFTINYNLRVNVKLIYVAIDRSRIIIK